MPSTWRPLSTILCTDPPCVATPRLVRGLLQDGETLELRYAGDRMRPAVRHDDVVRVRPLGSEPPRRGQIVLAMLEGRLDLLRVLDVTPRGSADGRDGRVRVAGDADPEAHTVPVPDILGRAELPVGSPPGGVTRWTRRLCLDLREAWSGAPDRGDAWGADAARSILEKYDDEAPHYAVDERTDDACAGVIEAVGRVAPPGGRILVVGSGSGREACALAEAGWSVTGIDFSPAMVRLARERCRRQGVDVEIVQEDVRRHAVAAGSLACVLFTPDVYSFLPGRAQRTGLLGRMRGWLTGEGAVLLSARPARSRRDRSMLLVEWMAARVRPRRRRIELGDSHTRWIALDGSVRRAYVHRFSGRGLAREIRRGSFRASGVGTGLYPLRPLPGRSARAEADDSAVSA